MTPDRDAHRFTMIAAVGERIVSPMPADETAVEVLLGDGTITKAWAFAHIQEIGDWDFLPAGDDGEPIFDADWIAPRVVGWRHPRPLIPTEADIATAAYTMTDRLRAAMAWLDDAQMRDTVRETIEDAIDELDHLPPLMPGQSGIQEPNNLSAAAAEAERERLAGLYRHANQIADAQRRRAEAAEAKLTHIPSNFQLRVRDWLLACFGADIADNKAELNHRFLEEAMELAQSLGCTANEAHQLVDYVFGSPIGEPAQECGGVMVTLAALCHATGIDMTNAGETELARVWSKIEKIRAKQAAKPPLGPLPGPSEPSAAVTPPPTPAGLDDGASRAAARDLLAERRRQIEWLDRRNTTEDAKEATP